MIYYAHSPKGDIPGQTYEKHIQAVAAHAEQYANAMRQYAGLDGDLLYATVRNAAAFHDLGKLDEENQLVLSGKKTATALPKNHVDAGTAHFFKEQNLFPLAAVIIQAHHVGLADFIEEQNRGESAFRDDRVKAEVDHLLSEFEAIHGTLITQKCIYENGSMPKGNLPVFLRLALSCLTDADHGDTAEHYGNASGCLEAVPLKAAERLCQLDKYVAALKEDDSPRTLLRGKMYEACRDVRIDANIASCDSPVGSGKTTAIMAHLLSQAISRGLRRIIIVLPFTNIITQSVAVYRKALVLPGERGEDVVAELHHRADFENEEARHLTALWRAPIIVTTAVTFFETLASNSTATLRRLHELPGSAIFIDESHAALPAHLLPLAWKWMKSYANEWSCYWTLASGSLSRFWTIEEIAEGETMQVPEIVSEELRSQLSGYEKKRIAYKSDLQPRDIPELVHWIAGFPGPRLVILNTVQNAAVLADCMCEQFSRNAIEHLSSALTPADREQTLQRISERLDSKTDTDWTLVATSCVEAGVNFSFRTGFREFASLVSLLQAAGRVDREGRFGDTEIWSFCLVKGDLFNTNPGLEGSAEILRQYFMNEIEIEPSQSTRSLNDEIILYGLSGKHKTLVTYEKERQFPLVEKNFKVIETNTRIAVVDKGFADQLRFGKMDWRELQRNSVQIASYLIDERRAPEICDNIFYWNFGYDAFLGYMAGIVKLKKLEASSMII